MKAWTYILAILFSVIFLCNPAGAVPYTWTDVVEPEKEVYFSSVKNGGVQSYSYTHDITDDGFDLWPEDVVYAYDLVIDLYDDGDRDRRRGGREVARIDLPGRVSDERVEVDYFNVDLGMSFKGWISLNRYGLLDVTIDRVRGDFYFGSSILNAHGNDSAPVPEPATMLLLGTGLVGLVGVGRKRFKS